MTQKQALGKVTFRIPVQAQQTAYIDFQIGFGERVLLEKGSFEKSPFSRDFREFRDSREPQDSGKQERIQPFSSRFFQSKDPIW